MRSRLVALLLLVLVAGGAYVTSLPGSFVYDDEQVIVRNERVTDPARTAEVWSTPYWGGKLSGGLYRPLTLFTFALNHRLNGLEPLGWHLVNLALHVLVSLLVWLAALELLPAGAAIAAALLFAAHPIHTEAVANLVGRAELLAAAGFLGAWLLHTRNRLLAALALAAGLLAKEIAVVLPAALLLSDVVRRRKIDVPAYALYAVVLAGYFAARFAVLGSFTNPKDMVLYKVDNVIATLPFLQGLWTALAVFGRYLALLVVPWRLSADYSWPQITAADPGDPWAWLGLAGAILLLAAFLAAYARARRAEGGGASPAAAIAIGLGVFGLAFLPVSNFVLRIGTVMAERLLYLPSVGVVIAVAGAWLALAGRVGAPLRRAAPALTAVLVIAGTIACDARNRVWRDPYTLAEATVASSPRSARARYNLGVELYQKGRVEEAITELEKTVALDSTYSEAWVNLGGYRFGLGRIDAARDALRRGIAIDPAWWSAYVTLGGLEINEGHPERAVPLLEKAVAIEAGADQAWFNLGLARFAVGDTLGAIEAMRRSVALSPDDPDSRNSLAWYLAESGGPLDEALENANRAVALAPGAAAYDTRAEILARMGRIGEARADWERALAYPDADPGIRERMRRYADGVESGAAGG